MKSITIDFYGKEADYLLLQDVDDVMEYGTKILQRDACIAAQRMLKTGLQPDQFDHLITHDGPGGIIANAYYKSSMGSGVAAVFEAGIVSDEKIERLLGHVSNGEEVMINKVGGFCFRTPDTKILREGPYDPMEEAAYVINDDTKFINLENDAELEKHTIKYLEKVDPNYSYVCNLRSFSSQQLEDIFRMFKSKGGEAAYLYTTGFDIPQIHDYCRALRRAGVDKIDFEFNSGITDELQDAIDTISEKMEVRVWESKRAPKGP